MIKVVKKDGSRLTFDRQKVKNGLAKACWKRPISNEQIEAVVSSIERQIYDDYESEIETTQIGELVMAELRKLDHVAFVRFASVYREFKDVRDFVEELERSWPNRAPRRNKAASFLLAKNAFVSRAGEILFRSPLAVTLL